MFVIKQFRKRTDSWLWECINKYARAEEGKGEKSRRKGLH